MPRRKTKARLNLTVNSDVYVEAKRRMDLLSMTVSGFVEDMLIVFLKQTEPMAPLLDDKNVSERQAVIAMLQTLSVGQEAVSRGSFDLHSVMKELAGELQKATDTHKKSQS